MGVLGLRFRFLGFWFCGLRFARCVLRGALWGFGFGYGVLGWLLFFVGIAGLFENLTMYFLLGAGVLGLLSFQNLPILIPLQQSECLAIHVILIGISLTPFVIRFLP